MTGPGFRLGGRYRLDERIGAGGMGEVWRATDELLGRTVAVKLILPALLSEPGFNQRFLVEAQAMAGVSHPGVVSIHDFHTDATGAFLVMQYVHGEPLSRMLERVGRLSPQATMDIVGQAASALHAVHAQGIVHRDVKPANLLMRPDGSVMLTDFGIARTPARTALTLSGAVIGTPSYLAPEQVLSQPATSRTDVYTLGLVAYECLAGHRPFEGDNPYAVALLRLREPPPTLAQHAPPAVRAVIERALATDPAHRWPTAAAMADAARAALQNPSWDLTHGGRQLGTALSPSDPGRRRARQARPALVPRPGRLRRDTVITVVGVVLALLAGAVTWLALRPGTGATASPPGGGSSGTQSTPGTTGSGTGGIPAGFVACTGGFCPSTPACWGGLVIISGVTSPPRHIDCAQPHYWQTFVAAYLPAAAIGVPEDEMLQRPDIGGICSADALARHSHDPARTKDWELEPLALKGDDGTWILQCLAGAGNGEVSGSLS